MKRKFIKFGTDWCGGCRQIKPIFEALKQEGFKVIEANPEVDTEIRAMYGVQNLPTVIIIDEDGVEITRAVGRKSKTEYIELFNTKM